MQQQKFQIFHQHPIRTGFVSLTSSIKDTATGKTACLFRFFPNQNTDAQTGTEV